ncbi:hypothetical protein AOQ84DRAFT_16758 [Glonium stellatum]|uniref:Uncharacterized protein n=1 Tax=Glonium stellatum TaxID=574774 RepID=A0A8E2JLB2_9PEZI|nr:hypothetical protein AOQ84DRAFT_16758 [Glonium stellatum]
MELIFRRKGHEWICDVPDTVGQVASSTKVPQTTNTDCRLNSKSNITPKAPGVNRYGESWFENSRTTEILSTSFLRFAELPAELQLYVLEMMVVSHKPIVDLKPAQSGIDLNILRVNRFMYENGNSAFFSKNVFHFTNAQVMMDRVIEDMTLFPDLKRSVAKSIRHISVDFNIAIEDLHYKTLSQLQLSQYILGLRRSYYLLPSLRPNFASGGNMVAPVDIEQLVCVPRRYVSSFYGFMAACGIEGIKTTVQGITDTYTACKEWTSQDGMDHVSNLKLPFRSVTLRLAGADILDSVSSPLTGRYDVWPRHFAQNTSVALDMMPELQELRLVGLPTDTLRQRYRDAMLARFYLLPRKREHKATREDKK